MSKTEKPNQNQEESLRPIDILRLAAEKQAEGMETKNKQIEAKVKQALTELDEYQKLMARIEELKQQETNFLALHHFWRDIINNSTSSINGIQSEAFQEMSKLTGNASRINQMPPQIPLPESNPEPIITKPFIPPEIYKNRINWNSVLAGVLSCLLVVGLLAFFFKPNDSTNIPTAPKTSIKK